MPLRWGSGTILSCILRVQILVERSGDPCRYLSLPREVLPLTHKLLAFRHAILGERVH